jgi:hypothetical protein
MLGLAFLRSDEPKDHCGLTFSGATKAAAFFKISRSSRSTRFSRRSRRSSSRSSLGRSAWSSPWPARPRDGGTPVGAVQASRLLPEVIIPPQARCPEDRVNSRVDLFTQLHRVMSRNLLTLPDGIDAREAFDRLHEGRHRLAPVIDPEGRLIGILTHPGALRATLYRSTVDARNRLRVAAALGVSGDVVGRAKALLAAERDVVVCAVRPRGISGARDPHRSAGLGVRSGSPWQRRS